MDRYESVERDAATQAEADAQHAWMLATGLGDDAGPERTAAFVSMLLQHVEADTARLEAAAARCRSQSRDDEESGLIQAEQLIGRAQQRLATAGSDRDATARDRVLGELHAEWHPEPQPFDWNHRRRRRLGWWLRWASTGRARFRFERSGAPAGIQRSYLDLGGKQVGRLLYQVCDECHLGLIGKITIRSDWQGWGLGTRMVRRVHAGHREYAWHTTPQELTSGTFWKRMSRLTGAAFTEAPPCVHMDRDLGAS